MGFNRPFVGGIKHERPMSEQFGITEEMAEAKWHGEIATAIQAVVDRLEDPSGLQVAPQSVMADDDVATDPYQLSHSARWCLNSAVNHLHALKTLVVDARALHSSASYGLARGALENLGAAFWILHSDDRAIRIEHSLRWWTTNYKDQERATKTMSNRPPLAAKLDRIEALARAASCDLSKIRNGYSSTEALTYADTNSTASNPYLIWQICSGFAHGRPWAALAMNEMEKRPTEAPGISLVRFTADHTRLLAVTKLTMHLLEDVLRLYQDRSAGA
ncbi:hypothetical protein [Mycobacteroides abscessus]|uniref:hypothetical protein n=1 Tax=Mycobacteroides abscessus TaxID=36809 RepID=UPI0012FFFDE1|nr:hypothetical protein [Mycobacteroides abscessus]